jgi:hypothetical protein
MGAWHYGSMKVLWFLIGAEKNKMKQKNITDIIPF